MGVDCLRRVRFLLPDSFSDLGGPYKTVNLFREAVGGVVVSPTVKGRESVGDRGSNTEYVFTKQQHWFCGAAKMKLVNLLSDASLISCHMIFRGQNILCREIAQKQNIPYWAVPHGSMDPWVFSYGRLQKEIWYKLIGKKYFDDARFVILATERERDKMAGLYQGDNLRVVHWPVEPLDVSRREEFRESLRSRLGIDRDSRILLFFGRYHSMKRPLETIEAFKSANPQETVHLVLAGIEYDVSEEQLKQAAGALDGKQVHVLGPVFGEERLEVLLGSDGYVSLSFRENFNHTAAESMTAGLPVILSMGNDLQFSFPKGSDFGWCLGTDEEAEFVSAISSFADAPDSEIRKKGDSAREWACDYLSFERFRSKLLGLAEESV